MMIKASLMAVPAMAGLMAEFALRGVLLGLVAWATLTLFRVKPASVRLFAWTTVLYALLALPLLGWILPPVALPGVAHMKSAEVVLPAPVRSVETARTASSYRVPASGSRLVASENGVSTAAESAHRHPWWDFVSWSLVGVWIYLGVLLALISRFAVGLAMTRRLLLRAKVIEDANVGVRLRSYAETWRSVGRTRIAESEAVQVPVTVGVMRPVILLPTNWREWEEAKLAAVIAHESSHVARRDSLTQNLALLYRAIFWFSPFAWWLHRQLVELAEQASDEAVLRAGADCADYARTLLGFFEALRGTPGRVWWHGVAMAKTGQAERRVEKILEWRGAFGMGLKRSMAVLIVAIAIPVVYLSAAVSAQQAAPAAPSAPAARPAPAVVPNEAPEPVSEPNPAMAPMPGTEPTPAVAPPDTPPPALASVGAFAPPAPPAAISATAPVVAWAGQSSSSYHVGNAYAYGYDEDERFVIVRGNSESLTMSGSTQDARHVERLRKKISGDFIWFQRDERSYVIRDQATVERALKLWAPQEELGKKQEALGKQQEELGKQQEALGKKMEQVRVQVPDMTAQLDKLRAELKELNGGATQEQIGRLQSEIGELQSRLGEVQSHAGDQQSKLGEEMGTLGEQQGKLGEEQGKLGEQQGELARQASREMKELLDEALKNGKAQPEPASDEQGML